MLGVGLGAPPTRAPITVPSVPGLTPDYGVIGQPIADLGTWAMGAGQLVGGAGLIVVALVLVALLTLGASKTVGKLAG